MSHDDERRPGDAGHHADGARKPWFTPNRAGIGYHPSRWQGWVVLALAVGALVAVVLLFITGVW